VWIAALGFVPFQQLVLHGQIGVLVLAALTAAWLAMRSGHLFWAGVACGSLAFKPQFGVAALLLVAVSLSPRVLAGAAVGAFVQVAAVTLFLGTEPWLDYVGMLPRMIADADQFEPKPWQMHSLIGFFRLLLDRTTAAHIAIVAASAFVVVVLWRAWRRSPSADVRFAALVISVALLNPHLYVYDLIVLVLPIAILSAWAVEHPEAARKVSLPAALHLVVWVPLLGPLAALTHVQLSTLCMLLLLLCVERVARVEGAVSSASSSSCCVRAS
jgi:hypothetical protein